MWWPAFFHIGHCADSVQWWSVNLPENHDSILSLKSFSVCLHAKQNVEHCLNIWDSGTKDKKCCTVPHKVEHPVAALHNTLWEINTAQFLHWFYSKGIQVLLFHLQNRSAAWEILRKINALPAVCLSPSIFSQCILQRNTNTDTTPWPDYLALMWYNRT